MPFPFLNPPALRRWALVALPACALLSFDPGLAEAAAPEPSGKLYTCNPGPWGTVHYFYVYLEAPEALVENFPTPNSVPRWCFPGWSVDQVRSVLDRAKVDSATQEVILDSKRTLMQDGILCVFPPLAQLEALTPGQRSVIYAELAKFEVNEFHQSPVFITSGSVDDWLKGTELRSELVEKIRGFTYKRGEALAFSDLSAILNYVRNDKEARQFFKIITRTRTLMARLEVKKGADIAALTEYWTGHNRLKDIAPILQSVIETQGIDDIPIVHLLPSLPRQFLYSYPSMTTALDGRMPDCHWTSLNFFNHKPKDYYLDTRLAANCVLESYLKVDPPYHFGDVLMFMDQSTGQAFHSCVYVADDIVYTKNGENAVAPWMLQKIDEVERIYFPAERGVIQGYRVKQLVK
jgi:hypothetical protein